MINTALRQWRAGERSVGVWIGLSDPLSAEAIAGMGFDWLCVDLQHGFMDAAALAPMLAALGASKTTPMVRVAAGTVDQIGKALDAGAHGVIVPMVSTVEEAERAASACRYQPRGLRSCGPVRGVTDLSAYIKDAEREIACVLMIETAEGLANAAAIAATPGVDALFIGPVDLCLSLGLGASDFTAPAFVAALDKVRAACRAAGKPAGIFGYDADLAAGHFEGGFTFASAGTDTGFLRRGAADALARARPRT